MSNIRKLQYFPEKGQCAINVGGKLHYFNPGAAFDARGKIPGHFGVKVGSQNFFFPVNNDTNGNPYIQKDSTKIADTIPPLVFPRIRADAQFWRDAIIEAEMKPWNWRVKMSQLSQDTRLDAHVSACIDKRKRMTLLKRPAYFKNGKEQKGFDFIHTYWWTTLMDFALEAQFDGYQLIQLGDMVNGGFPNISIVPRQNISPDREVVSPVVYMVSGVPFNLYNFSGNDNLMIVDGKKTFETQSRNKNGERYYDWSIWIKTPNIFGEHTSSCGYGLLYKVGLYALYIRNNLQFNATFNECFIQPVPWLQTSKSDETERQQAFDELLKMGSSRAFLTDLNDKFSLLENKTIGTGYEAYDKFEERMQKAISAMILGHQDAMHMIPGRMGSQEGAEFSPVLMALREVEAEQDKWISYVEKEFIRPKLVNLGFDIPDDVTYGYMNDEEDNAIQDRVNKTNLDFGKVLQLFSIAGYRVPKEFIESTTGIPVEEIPTTPNNDPEELGDIAEPKKIKK